MDDIEKELRRHRPAGPPSDFRERITSLAASERFARRRILPSHWLPAMTAVVVTVLLYWMAANESRLIATRIPPYTDDAVIATLAEPWP
jgi:hypothetical protein